MSENSGYHLIHFTIGGTAIKGESKIAGFTDWFEGDADPTLAMHITGRTIEYGLCRVFIPTTKASWDIHGKLMNKDYGQVDIKVAALSSDSSKANYSAFIREFSDCDIYVISQAREGYTFLFKTKGSVSVSAEIPKDGGKTEKLGPSVYDLVTNKPK